MNLPCILKTTGGHTVCLFENGFGYHMDGCYKGVMTDCKFSIAGSDKNITTEYLANTYGEVKSKEHAEFIKLLAENAGIDVFPQLLDANHFVIKGKLSFHNCERITSSELKQITIPLPPESNVNTPEEDFEMTQVAKNNGDNLIFGGDDKCKNQVPESDYNELLKRFDHMCELHGQLSTITQLLTHDGVDVEELLNIGSDGYNIYSKKYIDWRKRTITALTNVVNVGEGRSNEWPRVGSKVTYQGELCEVLLIADKSGHVVVSKNGCYCNPHIDDIENPKTPEEELRDEIVELTLGHMENKEHPIEANAYYLVSDIIEKYIKKPQ